MVYIPGETYSVQCAELEWKEDGRTYYLPVIGLPHSDPAFEFPHHHYHIDGRFEIHPRMRHQLQILDGYTAAVILTKGTDLYFFKGLVSLSLICKQTKTGLAVPPANEKYRQWYQGYIGQSCIGRKCPHLGAEMLEQNGRLVCPLHGLVADNITLSILPL